MSKDKQQIVVMKDDVERKIGRTAQENNIMAACIISDVVKSTLGPKGLDKMLVDSLGDVIITNDGATILKEIDIEHPTAKIIIKVAKSQDEKCGDGTTSAVVLTGELLKQAKELLDQEIHPTVIITGYQLAAKKAKEILKDIAIDIDISDRVILKDIAKTSMNSKSINSDKGELSELVVDAITKVAKTVYGKTVVDLNDIKIQKVLGDTVSNTKLIDGLVIEKQRILKEMPSKVEKAKVILIGTDLEVKKSKNDTKINISNPTQLQEFMDEEERILKNIISKIDSIDANVVICQNDIDDYVVNKLSKNGVFVLKRVNKQDMIKLSNMIDKRIVGDINDITEDDVAEIDLVEQKKVGDTDFTFINTKSNTVTIMLYGTTTHIVDEVDRAMYDALFVTKVALEDGNICAGGGATMIEMAKRLKKYAPSVGGREQMAIMAYANALEIIPKTLATNAGLNSIDVILDLRAKHEKGNKYHGIDINSGKSVDMIKHKVLEPLRLTLHEIDSSLEASTMILRIDDVIAAKQPPNQQG
jgi:archaeal chaperonin